jgi:signal transduction histidine kinase
MSRQDARFVAAGAPTRVDWAPADLLGVCPAKAGTGFGRLISDLLENARAEIFNPLNVIVGYAEDLELSASEIGASDLCLGAGAILKASIRLSRMAKILADWTALEFKVVRLRPSALSLDATVKSVLSEFLELAIRKRLSLTWGFELNPTVIFDDYCLRRTLAILLDNAIESSPKGCVHVSIFRGGSGRISLSVVDTGRGGTRVTRSQSVPRGLEDDSFEASDSRAFELGSLIAHQFVELNGAEFELDSRPTGGTMATIRFRS